MTPSSPKNPQREARTPESLRDRLICATAPVFKMSLNQRIYAAEADIEKVAEALRECRRVVRDEPDYDVFCAKRVLSALQGET